MISLASYIQLLLLHGHIMQALQAAYIVACVVLGIFLYVYVCVWCVCVCVFVHVRVCVCFVCACVLSSFQVHFIESFQCVIA